MPTGKEYEAVMFGQQDQSYKQTERESVSGDYGQCTPQTLGHFTSGDDMIPEPVPSMQFSSNKQGDPKKLVREAVDSINAHADLMDTYGYHQPVATLGSHPWLRDELANPTELEPGNAEPIAGMKVPERAKAGR